MADKFGNDNRIDRFRADWDAQQVSQNKSPIKVTTLTHSGHNDQQALHHIDLARERMAKERAKFEQTLSFDRRNARTPVSNRPFAVDDMDANRRMRMRTLSHVVDDYNLIETYQKVQEGPGAAIITEAELEAIIDQQLEGMSKDQQENVRQAVKAEAKKRLAAQGIQVGPKLKGTIRDGKRHVKTNGLKISKAGSQTRVDAHVQDARNVENKVLKRVNSVSFLRPNGKTPRNMYNTPMYKALSRFKDQFPVPTVGRIREQTLSHLFDGNVVESGYQVVGENVQKVYFVPEAVPEGERTWRSLAEIEGHESKYVLSGAGAKEFEENEAKLRGMREDAKILRAMQQDMNQHIGQSDIHFKNTLEAMKATKHRALVAEHGELAFAANKIDAFDAFRFINAFMTKHANNQGLPTFELPGRILPKEGIIHGNIAGFVGRALDDVSMHTPRRFLNRKDGEVHNTPFGELMDQQKRLSGIKSDVVNERKDLETWRESVTDEQGGGTTVDAEFATQGTLDAKTREARGELVVQQDDFMAERDKATREGQKWKGERVLAPTQETRYAMDSQYMHEVSVTEGPDGKTTVYAHGPRQFSEQEQANIAEWKAQAERNPGQLYYNERDKIAHSIATDSNGKPMIDERTGVIQTVREHVAIRGEDRAKMTFSLVPKGMADIDAFANLENALDMVNNKLQRKDTAAMNEVLQETIQIKLNDHLKALDPNGTTHRYVERSILTEHMFGGKQAILDFKNQARIPNWLYDTLKERAGWMFGAVDGDMSLIMEHASLALAEGIPNNIDLAKMQGEEFDKLLAGTKIDSEFMQHVTAGVRRDIAGKTIQNYFDAAKSNNDGSMQNMLKQLVKDYRYAMGDDPTQAEIVDFLKQSQHLLDEKKNPQFKGIIQYARDNFDELLGEDSGDVHFDAFRQYDPADVDASEAYRQGEDYVSEFDTAFAKAQKNGDFQTEEELTRQGRPDARSYETYERYVHENYAEDLDHAQRKRYAGELFFQAKGAEGDLVHILNKVQEVSDRNHQEIWDMFQKGAMRDQGPRALLEFVQEDLFSGNAEIKGAAHAQAIAELSKWFNIEVKVEEGGQTHYGQLTQGAKGEAFFNDQTLGRNRVITDIPAEATGEMMATNKFETNVIRSQAIEDYRPMKAGIPVITNQPNVRAYSRIGKDSFVPQTIGETLEHTEAVRNGARVVSMDMETTALTTAREDLQHPLEIALQDYQYQDGKLVQTGEKQIFVKPSEQMMQQVKDFRKNLRQNVTAQVADALGIDSTNLAGIQEHLNGLSGEEAAAAQKTVAKAINSNEELSFLRNIAKYTKKGAQYADYNNAPANLSDFVEGVFKDSKRAVDNLNRRKSAVDLATAMEQVSKHIGDDIVLAQNGGRAEKVWMDIFTKRIGTQLDDTFETSVAALKEYGVTDKMFALAKDWKSNVGGSVAMSGIVDLAERKGMKYEDAFEHMSNIANHFAFEDLQKRSGPASQYGNETIEDAIADYDSNVKGSMYHHYTDLSDKEIERAFHTGRGGTKFNPNMIELMHLSKLTADGPKMKHNLTAQAERALAAGAISQDQFDAFTSNAHYANADTKMSADLLEHYMNAMPEEYKGYEPEYLKKGQHLVKFSQRQDDLAKGAYEVLEFNKDQNALRLKNIQTDREVLYHTPSHTELNARIQDNFLVLPQGQEGKELAEAHLDAMSWDDARRSVQDSKDYASFMNNRLKQMGAADAQDGFADIEHNQRLQDALAGATQKANTNKTLPDAERIPLTDTERVLLQNADTISNMPTKTQITPKINAAAETDAASKYWNSAEADLMQDVFGRVQDLQHIGAIDHEEARNIVGRVAEGFENIGAEAGLTRGTRRMEGMIDVGMLDEGIQNHGNERLLLHARSEAELYNSLWAKAGELMDGVSGSSLNTVDSRKAAAIDRILIPTLQSAGLYNPPISDLVGGVKQMAGQDRLVHIARQVYQNAQAKGMTSAEVTDINPIITDANQGKAQQFIDDTFNERVGRLGAAEQESYTRAQVARAELQREGGMLPSRINTSLPAENITADFNPTIYNKDFSKMGLEEIGQLAFDRNQPEEERKAALRELQSKARGRDAQATIANHVLSWDNPDMREHIMPTGEYAGKKLGDLPQDALNFIKNSEDAIYDRQKNMVANYEVYQRGYAPAGGDWRHEPLGPLQGPSLLASDDTATEIAFNDSTSPETSRGRMEAEAARQSRYQNFVPAQDTVPRDVSDFVEQGNARRMFNDASDGMRDAFRNIGKKGLLGGGLILAGMAVLGNWINDPKPESRPTGDSPDVDGNYAAPPGLDTGDKTARVQPNGGGNDGMRVTVRGRAPGHMSNEQIANMAGEGIRSSVGHETNVKIHSTDDTSSIGGEWLRQTYTDFMRNGIVGQ